jgi:hypothetical protein
MQLCLVLLTAMSLTACSESFNDLEREYGQDQISDTKPISTDTFFITSRKHAGATSFNGIAKVRLSPGGIELTTGAPFTRGLAIPASDVEYCGMTCFGTSDPYVDLLIPKTGTSITIRNKEQMLDWCWSNHKPIISGKDKRNWEYNNLPLPPQRTYAAQLGSRKSFDEQVCQSCMGY